MKNKKRSIQKVELFGCDLFQSIFFKTLFPIKHLEFFEVGNMCIMFRKINAKVLVKLKSSGF